MNLDRPVGPDPYELLPPVPSFTLRSDDVLSGEPVPVKHAFNDWGAPGENISPHLAWEGFPAETQSFAVTMFDPDAPTASGFWHWHVLDIPVGVTELPQGAGRDDQSLPGGFHTTNDYGVAHYGGPAPPAGDRPHRYFIVVHALDVESLGLAADTRSAAVGFNLTMHTLARATLVPVFAL
jgi:Raf kinase inhibitor-like YbhB/YbcL family protein